MSARQLQHTGDRPQRVKGTVESTAYSMCGYRAGDAFELVDGALTTTPENGVCLYILSNVIGLLATRPDHLTTAEWVATGPITTCSDGPERTVVRLSLVDD